MLRNEEKPSAYKNIPLCKSSELVSPRTE